MIRLRRDDFDDPHETAKFAATLGLSLDQFRREFEYLIENEPPPLVLDFDKHVLVQGPATNRHVQPAEDAADAGPGPKGTVQDNDHGMDTERTRNEHGTKTKGAQ
jgi:hypothetical protein